MERKIQMEAITHVKDRTESPFQKWTARPEIRDFLKKGVSTAKLSSGGECSTKLIRCA